jgi:osmotically-inducible protein OsmY
MIRLALGVIVACGLIGCAEQPTMERRTGDVERPEPVDVDNTAVNLRDRHSTVKTPINQDEDQEDLNITAEIRRRVVDTELSVNGRNVKIITQDGRVTLRGPVKSEDERKRIVDIATDVAGTGNVENQLEVEINP